MTICANPSEFYYSEVRNEYNSSEKVSVAGKIP